MLDKKYQSKESAIASYDWIDIASGTGFITFYPFDTADGLNILTTNSDISSYPYFHYGTSSSYLMQETFETIMSSQRFVSGTAFINVPVLALSSNTYNLITTIYKNTISIGTTTTNNIAAQLADNGTIISQSVALTNTSFAPEDVLKVKIEVYWNEVTSSTHGTVYHDPKGRTAVNPVGGAPLSINCQMSVSIPFRIDI